CFRRAELRDDLRPPRGGLPDRWRVRGVRRGDLGRPDRDVPATARGRGRSDRRVVRGPVDRRPAAPQNPVERNRCHDLAVGADRPNLAAAREYPRDIRWEEGRTMRRAWAMGMASILVLAACGTGEQTLPPGATGPAATGVTPGTTPVALGRDRDTL